MNLSYYGIFSALICVCISQRPSYIGNRPIGYPILEEETTAAPSNNGGNRFGPSFTASTERLPLEAAGDRKLIERLRKLPIDQQPFWLINAQQIEENRKQPKTYPLKPNFYLDPIPTRPTLTTTQLPWWFHRRYYG